MTHDARRIQRVTTLYQYTEYSYLTGILTGVETVLGSVLRYPKRPFIGVVSKLLDLDQYGLTEAEFKMIIAKCNCGLIMTRRAFHFHQCLKREIWQPAVQERLERTTIDLTMDDEELGDKD